MGDGDDEGEGGETDVGKHETGGVMAQFRFRSERRRGSFGGGEVEWAWWAWKRQERMMCLGWPPRACAAKWEWVNGPKVPLAWISDNRELGRARSSPRYADWPRFSMAGGL